MAFYTHHGMLLSYKKGNHAICCNMNGPRDYYTKWSKTEKDMMPLIYGILKSIQMNLFTKKTHRCTMHIYGYQTGNGGYIGSMGLTDVHYHI